MSKYEYIYEYIFVYDKLVWFENISISRTQDNA